VLGGSRLRVLGIVLAGGKGTRLFPLTRERAKPAVPFGGKYRIIDFVLSNFVNSGINSIYVLTQFRSQSLLQHLSEGWHVDWELVSRSWRSRIWRGALRPALAKSEENLENQ